MNYKTNHAGRDKVVGTATRYWLDGREIKSRCSRITSPVPTYPRSYTICTGSFPG